MVLGPEQVKWTTIFHNYLRSSVTNFRGSRTENMSRWSSVVQVIGGAGHRWWGHWCCKSSVVHITGGHRWHRSPETSVVYYSSYYIHYLQYFISNVLFTLFFIIIIISYEVFNNKTEISKENNDKISRCKNHVTKTLL